MHQEYSMCVLAEKRAPGWVTNAFHLPFSDNGWSNDNNSNVEIVLVKSWIRVRSGTALKKFNFLLNTWIPNVYLLVFASSLAAINIHTPNSIPLLMRQIITRCYAQNIAIVTIQFPYQSEPFMVGIEAQRIRASSLFHPICS